MKFYETGCDRYYVTARIGNMETLIAEVNPPLVGHDKLYIDMHFPYEESSTHTVYCNMDMTRDEMLEMAKKVISKKVSEIQQSLQEATQTVEIDDTSRDENREQKETMQHKHVYGWVKEEERRISR